MPVRPYWVVTQGVRSLETQAGGEQIVDVEGAVRAIGRRRVAASVTRTILTTVVLLVVYYRAPLDRPADLGLVLWLAVGLTPRRGHRCSAEPTPSTTR